MPPCSNCDAPLVRTHRGFEIRQGRPTTSREGGAIHQTRWLAAVGVVTLGPAHDMLQLVKDIDRFLSTPLALVSFPGHDEQWVECGTCEGRLYHDHCPFGRMGMRCCGACDVDECPCVESVYPGIEPFDGDPLDALVPVGAFLARSSWTDAADFLPAASGPELADLPF